MNLSRRSLLRGGVAAGALLGLGGTLAACSKDSGGGGNADSKEVAIWIWPSGFSEELMAYVNGGLEGAKVTQNVIGGDFKQKLTTQFAAKTGLPPITGVKGEDMPFFREKGSYFEDLNELGFKDIAAQYLDWKVTQGQTTDGKQIGFPIDIGPTVTFYRFDIFEQLGLPSDPKALEANTKTWEDYFELGKQMTAASADTFLIRNAASVWATSLAQQKMQYITKDNEWVGGDEHVKLGWDRAVAALDAGIVARIDSNTPDVQAMVNTGKLPADFGAAWHLDDLQSDAPDTAGKWHVTDTPGGAANQGGSFLTIPKGTANKEFAYQVIAKMMDAKGQEMEYEKKGYFPSMPETYESAALTGPNEFLGGQKAIEYFGKSAQENNFIFQHALDDTVGAPFVAELQNVEQSGKDPKTAWDEAVAASKKIAEQNGLKVA